MFARRDYWVSSYDDSGAKTWLDSAGIDLIRGNGRLAGERAVEVDGTTYRANVAVVLATGTAAAVPDIPGLRDAQPWTNIEATAASTVPQRLVVLGGGVVACEMAQVFAALGSSVTVIERGDRLLGRAEPVASAMVRDGLKREGATIRLGVTADSVSRPSPAARSASTCPTAPRSRPTRSSCALGRTPRTEELGLETVGVKVDERGYVEVDDTGEVTSVPGQWLYAVGDVNGRNLLTHMGKYQGRVAGDVIAARAAGAPTDGPGMAAWADHLGAPQVVFTDPEVASAGLTEAMARADGRQIRVVDVDMGSVSGVGPAGRRLQRGRAARGRCRDPGRAGRHVRRPGRRRDGARRRDRRDRAPDRRPAVARRTVLPHHERGLAAAARGVRPVTSRPPEIDLWDAARARVSAAGLWRVYDEVRGEGESFDAWRAGGVRPRLRPGRVPPLRRAVRPRDRRATPMGSSASAGSRGPTGSRRHCPRRWPRRGSAGTSSWRTWRCWSRTADTAVAGGCTTC